jgi:hypothetical protein
MRPQTIPVTPAQHKQKLRMFLLFDTIAAIISIVIFVLGWLHIVPTVVKLLNIPVLLIIFPIFYHFLRRNHHYRGPQIPPMFILSNLNCWLYYRLIILALFTCISGFIFFWGLFLYLTEGAEFNKLADQAGSKEESSGIINAIFMKPLKYAGIETLIMVWFIVG